MAQSLYRQASLIMNPYGAKDTLLPSIKPTDGSGDFTFSRDGAGASPATRVNASGLIEKGRTNIAIYSEDTTNALYAKSNISVTANNATSPIGTATADTLTATANGATLQGVVTAVSGRVYTMSVYIKRRTGTGQVGLRGINNLVTNVTITNDWQRYEVFMVSNSIIGRYGVYLATAGDEVDVWGFQLEESLTATEYIATTTAPVSAGLLGDMPRLDYSGGATCPSLLLEPSRVNSMLQSEYIGSYFFYTNASASNNQTTSPEGVVNAASIIPDATSGQHQIASSNISASGSFTLSAFVKAGELNKVAIRESNATGAYASFNLSTGTKIEDNVSGDAFIEPFENDWYRIGVTYTHSGNIRLGINVLDNSYTTGNPSSGTTYWSSNGTDKLYVYGLQCELSASYPTSYIPTYGSASGRAFDDCEITSASDLFGSSVGSIYVEGEVILDTNGSMPFTAGNGTANLIYAWMRQDGQIVIDFFQGGLQQAVIISGGGFISNGDSFKLAIGYQNNDFVAYVNGTQLSTSIIGGTAPNPTTLILGGYTAPNYYGSGIKQALVFPTRLTNAELAALTA